MLYSSQMILFWLFRRHIWCDFSYGRYNKLTNEQRYSMRPSRTSKFRRKKNYFNILNRYKGFYRNSSNEIIFCALKRFLIQKKTKIQKWQSNMAQWTRKRLDKVIDCLTLLGTVLASGWLFQMYISDGFVANLLLHFCDQAQRWKYKMTIRL